MLKPISWVSASALCLQGAEPVGAGNGTQFLITASETLYFLLGFLDNRAKLINTCGPRASGKGCSSVPQLSFLVCETRKLGLMTSHIYFPAAEFWDARLLPYYNNDFSMAWIFFYDGEIPFYP